MSARNAVPTSLTPTSRCSVELTASGTLHQLANFLREAADQLEQESMLRTIPWWQKGSGMGFHGELNVTEL